MIPITITYTPYAEGVKIIGVTGRAAEIRIPDHIDGLPVIAIAPYAFAVQTEAEASETETPAQLSFVEGEDNSLLDVLVNDDSPMADRSLVNESLSREIDRALSTLTEREKDIIQMFFGINTQEMTLEEIGDKFGLTRERVRQIKEKAIRRLRQNSRSKLLKSYLG